MFLPSHLSGTSGFFLSYLPLSRIVKVSSAALVLSRFVAQRVDPKHTNRTMAESVPLDDYIKLIR